MKRPYRDYLPYNPPDSIGPRQVCAPSQIGAGGPIVLRSNPIGAIFDAIRGFCFPVQMEETPAGYEAEGGYGSPGTETFGGGYDSGGGGGSFGYAFTPPTPTGVACAAGTHWDTMANACAPDAPAQPVDADPCSQSNLIAARKALVTARNGCDRPGMEQVLATARSCRDTSMGSRKAAWNQLAAEAKAALDGHKKRCAMPNPKGKIDTMTPQSGPPQMGMPATASTQSLTEGNVDMMSSPQPMMGAVDPGQMIGRQVGRVPFGVRR